MSIDWITVAAQIANFLVLVWLLKRFLYKPVLNGIDAREAEIARRMHEADVAREQAETAENAFHQKAAQMQAERDAAVAEALQSTERDRDAMLAEARSKLAREQQEQHILLEHERQKFRERLQQAGTRVLLELTRKALLELADEKLEAAVVRHVSGQLAAMAEELASELGGGQTALAITRDPLPDEIRSQLQGEISQRLPGAALRFETDSQQSPGLVLQVGGAQLAWTVDSYADELQTLLSEQLAVEASGRGEGQHG